MIRLFISDIDGCLGEPYQPYDLNGLAALAAEAVRAGRPGSHPTLPALSLCSGRAYPYVEAMSQILALQAPVLFESGGGCFDPVAAQVRWNDAFTPALEAQLRHVRDWLLEAVVPGTQLMFDYGKRTQAGVIGPEEAEVRAAVPQVEVYVARRFADLCVFHTPYSIDVVPRCLTKLQGITGLCTRLGLPLKEVAYIGDANGDLEALEAVGFAFAPANAADEVKRRITRLTAAPGLGGVREAYRWCVAHNAACE